MKKVFCYFVVGMMFLGSLVVSGVTIDDNETIVTEKENFAPYIPCMGTFRIYNWDPIRYDIEVDDTHQSIYNDIEGWTTSDGYKNVTIEWEINKEDDLSISKPYEIKLFWRIREWAQPPGSIFRFFRRYLGHVRLESYTIYDIVNDVPIERSGMPIKPPEGKLLYKIPINWGPADGNNFPKEGYVEIKLDFTKADLSDMNIVAFLWAGFGSLNWDYSVIHAHFKTPTPP